MAQIDVLPAPRLASSRQARPAQQPVIPPDGPSIDQLPAAPAGGASGQIYRSGNNFSDQRQAGGSAFAPARSGVSATSSGTASVGQQGAAAPGPLSRAVSSTPATGTDASGIPTKDVGVLSAANGVPSVQPNSTIYRNGNSFGDEPLAQSVPWTLGYKARNPASPEASINQAPSIENLPVSKTWSSTPSTVTGTDRVSGGPLTVIGGPEDTARIQAFLDRSAQEHTAARARQAQDFASSTASENQIAARNAFENAARNARIDAGSLLNVHGGRTQRQLLAASANFTNQAADIAALPPDADFISTPEKEAAISQSKLQNQIQQQNADANTLTAQAAATRAKNGPQETFANPTDELDAAGKPIRVQYGDRGSRRVIDGAQPVPKANSGISVGADGTLQVGSSNGAKITEQQSKDLNFYTRGRAALNNLGDGKALTSYLSNAGAHVPVVGNKLAGDDYQRQQQAGNEFLTAILRKDSGAAITKQEQDIYGRMYLPQPGDSANTLKQKAIAQQTALDAIKLGMGHARRLLPNDVDGRNTNAPGAGTDAGAEGDDESSGGQEQLRSKPPVDYSHLW